MKVGQLGFGLCEMLLFRNYRIVTIWDIWKKEEEEKGRLWDESAPTRQPMLLTFRCKVYPRHWLDFKPQKRV